VTERMGIWFLRGFATGLISVLYEDYMVNIVLHGYLAKVPLQFVMHVQWFSHVGSCRIVIRGYRHKPVSDVTASILFSQDVIMFLGRLQINAIKSFFFLSQPLLYLVLNI